MAKARKKEILFTNEIKEAFLNCDTVEKLQLFLNGRNINGFDEYGNNILHYYLKNARAFKLGWQEIIPAILSCGLNIDEKQSAGNLQSPLHLAVHLKEKEIADYLIAAGADINAIDANGNTVIWTAVMGYRGDGYFVETLIAHGADISRKNNSGISAIDLAENIANYDVKKYFE